MSYGKKILEESVPVLMLTAVISIFSGIFLNNNERMLRVLPGILVIIPSFISINGNVSSVITSRLSSALHMGLVKPDFRRSKILIRNAHSMLIVSLVAFPLLGIVAAGLNSLLGGPSTSMAIFPLITLTAGMITVLFLVASSVIFSYLTFRRGLDPDDVVVPLLTTLGDLVGISSLMLIMGLVV